MNENGVTAMEDTASVFLDGITDYEKVKDRICYRLVNTERSRDFLSTAPHRDFMDLSAAYYVCFELPDGRFASAAVTDRLAANWKVDEAELWNAAFENTQRIFPAHTGTLRSELAGLASLGGEEYTAAEAENNGIAIAPNEMKRYGAGSILYDGVLTRLTDIIVDNIFLLPSSVHEFLAVADDGMTDPGTLAGMVRSINTEIVSNAEVLSDHVYRYEKGGEITIAG